jgi:Na+-transporting NADH:ubiquinone oxidoreductase subunit NqrF
VRPADDEPGSVINMLLDLGVEPENIMLDDFGG